MTPAGNSGAAPLAAVAKLGNAYSRPGVTMRKPIVHFALVVGFVVGAKNAGVAAIKSYEHEVALRGKFIDYFAVYRVVPIEPAK